MGGASGVTTKGLPSARARRPDGPRLRIAGRAGDRPARPAFTLMKLVLLELASLKDGPEHTADQRARGRRAELGAVPVDALPGEAQPVGLEHRADPGHGHGQVEAQVQEMGHEAGADHAFGYTRKSVGDGPARHTGQLEPLGHVARGRWPRRSGRFAGESSTGPSSADPPRAAHRPMALPVGCRTKRASQGRTPHEEGSRASRLASTRCT